MGYEIDYIPVGDGERSGDAICLRYGNLYGSRNEQTVVVIDGGYKESGEKLVEHIKQYYGTSLVDLVVASHSDSDHISGLIPVLENLKVKHLAMHKPWEHSDNIKNFFKNSRLTPNGLETKLLKSLDKASALENLAVELNIPITEPFQGVKGFNNTFHVLGPSQAFYESLIALFRTTPEANDLLSKLLFPAQEVAREVAQWVEDTFDIDLLNDDNDETSAENNSSTIILFNVDGHKLLFTGDSGKTGLLNATTYANNLGIALNDLHFFDVPHHGSRKNLCTNVLKSVCGQTAFISASKESKKHPSRRVTNTLQKFNSTVFVNRDKTISHSHEAPPRAFWTALTPEPFHEKVED